MNIEIPNGKYNNSTHIYHLSSFSYLLDIKSKSLLCYFIVKLNILRVYQLMIKAHKE
jgi:hypothetical protein